MEPIAVKKEPFDRPSTSADQETLISGIAIKQEIKEELDDGDNSMDYNELGVKERSKIRDGDEESDQIKEEENFLKCHFCQYPTANISSKHGLKNEGENIKIHKCTNCSYSFVLKSHFDTHLKQRLILEKGINYKCHHCHYKTIKKSNLKSHIKSHCKTKQFKCLFCKYLSYKKQSLDNHILRKHSNFLDKSNKNCITSKVHECQYCQYKTTFAIHLKTHLNNNH